MVQSLAENGEIDAALRNRRIFDIAQAIFEICEPVLFGELGAELNHFRCVIDRDHFARGLGQELREGSFARSEIGDSQCR